MPLSDYIVTDDLTIVLGVIGISVYLLQNFYKPQPLVHPILLGRQSDVGRVRHPTESPVYRNYGTGLMGRFPIRPDKDVNVVNDMVRPQFEARRTLWSTKITNAQLNERVDAFGAGISRMLREDSNVLLLLNDGIEFLIADLALAKYSITSMTLCSSKLLSRVLKTHPPTAIITDADFIPLLLERIYDAPEHDHKIIVAGKYEGKHHSKSARQVEVVPWAQIETDGANITETIPAGTKRPDDSYTLAFFEAPSGEMQAVRFTHENMTSGVAAIRALFPPSMALSGVDTIVSNHSLSTPYGRAIAYSALYENASFATIDSTRLYDVTRVGDTQSPADAVQLRSGQPHNLADVLSARHHPIPYPTVLFIGPNHLEDLSSSILKHARESWLYSFAWRQKVAAFAEGFLSKDSLWDRTVFDNAREGVFGGMANALKVVISSGGPISSEVLTPARIALSIPVINMHVNPWVSGPVFATQAFDAQVLPSGHEPAHVGGPSVNVEAKLKGVKDTYLEENEDPVGEIVVRGPTVGVSIGQEAENVAWQEISEIGRAMTNGAFKVVGVCTCNRTPVNGSCWTRVLHDGKVRRMTSVGVSQRHLQQAIDRRHAAGYLGMVAKSRQHKDPSGPYVCFSYPDTLIHCIIPAMGSIFSAIGSGINAIISAIANVVMTIVGAITTVIVTIFDVIVDILCCRCFGSRRSQSRYRRRRGIY